MLISEAVTAIKVADVIKNPKNTQPLIVFDYNNYQTRQVLRNTAGRVYLLISDGVIKKIGYSQDRGGIQGTLTSYQGGMGGRPSIRTMGIHLLLNAEVELGRNVEVYMILADKQSMKVKGLFGEKDIPVSPTIEMEGLCKQDYLDREGRYPEWNIQETQGTEWPDWIKEQHSERLQESPGSYSSEND